jgi:hypothetical protein
MVRVVITGVGGVSGAGRDPDAMLDAIVEGRSAIRPIEGFDTTGWPVTQAAEIVDFNARSLVDDRKLHKLIRRTDMLGIYAGDRAAEAAGYATHRATLSPDASNTFADRTGIYVGSGAGAFENQHDFFPLMSESNGDLQAFGRNLADTVNPMWLLRTLPNNVLCHVGIRNRLKGTNASPTTASAAGWPSSRPPRRCATAKPIARSRSATTRRSSRRTCCSTIAAACWRPTACDRSTARAAAACSAKAPVRLHSKPLSPRVNGTRQCWARCSAEAASATGSGCSRFATTATASSVQSALRWPTPVSSRATSG